MIGMLFMQVGPSIILHGEMDRRANHAQKAYLYDCRLSACGVYYILCD